MKVGKAASLNNFRGINTVDDPSAIGPNTMVEGLNAYINNKRRIRRRAGKLNVISGSVHSVFATADQKTMVMVKDNVLSLANPDLSLIALRTGMVAGMQLSYAEINGTIYWSNSVQNGRIINKKSYSWGIARPNPVDVVRVGGTMQAGIYSFIATFIRPDGQESGTSVPVAINIPADSGVLVARPTTIDPDVTGFVLYVTEPDGTDYYAIGMYDLGSAPVFYNGVTSSMRATTQFLGPPPLGQIVSYFSGSALIAVGSDLFWTEPYAYELVDHSQNYKQLPDWIDIVAPVEDGVYLSYGGKIGFMRGTDLPKAELETLTLYGSTPGTLAYVDHVQGIDLPDKKIPVWSTEHGFVAGFKGGQLVNLTEDNYRPGKYRGGAAVYLQRDGDQLYIASHRGTPIEAGNVRNPTGITIENRGPL